MPFNPTSPVTGAPGTGLTSPTYTLSVDAPPAPNAKQWYVSALGGTQTGVAVSSVDKPFTISVFRPANFNRRPPVNPTTGVLPRVQRNVHKVITRKGGTPLAGQTPQMILIETVITVPAGVETADFPSVAAAVSLHCGALWEQSNEWGDALAAGTL
jgi:hypothetical protein